MMRYLLLLSFLIPLSVYSQTKLGKSRQQLTNELNQSVKNGQFSKAEFDDTKNRLVVSSRDSLGQGLRYEYGFDEKTGNCITEMTISTCEACMKNLLNELLAVTSYQWKKINESQYVSRFEDHLLIEWQQTGNEISFTLIRTAWTRELYNMLKEN